MDYSWVYHLSPEATEELEYALACANDSGKSWLEMTSNDFPLIGAAKYAIDRTYAVTQTANGM